MDFKDSIKWKESIKANIAQFRRTLTLLIFASGKEREKNLQVTKEILVMPVVLVNKRESETYVTY